MSSAPEGTVLKGLNVFKNGAEPVAMADAAYPPWLWTVLDKKGKGKGGADGADDAADAEADLYCTWASRCFSPWSGAHEARRCLAFGALTYTYLSLLYFLYT